LRPPQVGISKRIILIEQDLFNGTESDEPVILLNPEWRSLDDKKELDIEGCLSVPGKIGIVERYVNVELTASRYCGKTEQISRVKHEYRRNFSTVLWQHEIDHLDGNIYKDKAKLMLSEQEFHYIQSFLYQSQKIQQEMTIFDIGPLIYQIALEYQQEPSINILEFLQVKAESLAEEHQE